MFVCAWILENPVIGRNTERRRARPLRGVDDRSCPERLGSWASSHDTSVESGGGTGIVPVGDAGDPKTASPGIYSGSGEAYGNRSPVNSVRFPLHRHTRLGVRGGDEHNPGPRPPARGLCPRESRLSVARRRGVAQGRRAGLTSPERERLKALERENRELRRANEILRKASAYFAQAELDRRPKT